jgi:hypothetical protein
VQGRGAGVHTRAGAAARQQQKHLLAAEQQVRCACCVLQECREDSWEAAKVIFCWLLADALLVAAGCCIAGLSFAYIQVYMQHECADCFCILQECLEDAMDSAGFSAATTLTALPSLPAVLRLLNLQTYIELLCHMTVSFASLAAARQH